MPRLALIAGLALALAFVPSASSGVRGSSVAKGVPSGLHGFLLQADEPVTHQFPRTPSFAWTPAPERGGHYQFQLATSPSFQDSSIVFSDTNVPIPAETVPRQLPWMVGDPYALWVHVRWVSDNGMKATLWSKPFGFNMKWADKDVPTQENAPEGLVRWKPIEGATEYQVLYPDVPDTFFTTTNVADEREFFTFHPAAGYTSIHWRVRAVRVVSGKAGPSNGLPVVSYGPWSSTFTTTNPPQSSASTKATDTVSDYWSKTNGHRFGLTPGFAWTPAGPAGGIGGAAGPLYRVYIFSDNSCVNPIFTGSIVGSPAFAPRVIGGPIALPTDTKQLAADESGPYPGPGSEGSVLDAIGDPVAATEAGKAASTTPSSSSSTTSASTVSTAPADVDLWDTGWPSGRFYWTVVPVNIVALKTGNSSSSSSSSSDGSSSSGGSGAGSGPPVIPIGYQDGAIPQDECQGGNLMSFGKIARPVVTAAGRPYLSGVMPSGRTIAAAGKHAVVYESPIAAWQPATGATTYQVQISRTLYPWHTAKSVSTPATSLVLPLTKADTGTWYYRVRGIDLTLPASAQAMSWSSAVRVTITGDRFAIVK